MAAGGSRGWQAQQVQEHRQAVQHVHVAAVHAALCPPCGAARPTCQLAVAAHVCLPHQAVQAHELGAGVLWELERRQSRARRQGEQAG